MCQASRDILRLSDTLPIQRILRDALIMLDPAGCFVGKREQPVPLISGTPRVVSSVLSVWFLLQVIQIADDSRILGQGPRPRPRRPRPRVFSNRSQVDPKMMTQSP